MGRVYSITSPAPKGGISYKQITVDYENMPVILKPIYTGICGTDRGIVKGSLNFAYCPLGYGDLALGHESICRVISAKSNKYGIRSGDIVVPIVRRPGQCLNCITGRSDNCSDGDKHEAGVTGMHGFMREEFGDSPEYLLKVSSDTMKEVGVLTEPLKNVEKAFEVYDLVSRRSISTDRFGSLSEKRAIIIGTGSEAFLYALKCRDYGFQTLITNRHPIDDLKMKFLDTAGVQFFDYTKEHRDESGWDLVIDTSGDPGTIMRFLRKTNNNGNVILFGTNGSAPATGIDGQDIDHIIERNIFLIGSVDGARVHYELALKDLERWNVQYGDKIKSLITHRYSPDDTSVFTKKDPLEIKSVIDWSK